jgi:hypothetical protein
MKRNIDVMLGDGSEVGVGVGTLRYDLQGHRESAAFEYGAGWLGDPARFALGPTLPLQAGPQFHRKSKDGSLFHAAIADTEPDGWASLCRPPRLRQSHKIPATDLHIITIAKRRMIVCRASARSISVASSPHPAP